MKDWEWIAEMWCYGLWGFGVRPADSVFFAFSYGTFIGFWGPHYACEKIGCLVLPGGNMTTEARVNAIVDMSATVVSSTPTYALRMAQEAKSLGIDLAKGPVQRLILSGEPAGSIPATKKLIEEQWGAKAARHRRDDRARHDHDLRVRPPARRDAHHRGPLHRGGHRSRDRRAGRVRRAGRAGGHVVRARLHPGAAVPDARPRGQGPARPVRLRPDVRHLRGRASAAASTT